jgi:hypothetical protein
MTELTQLHLYILLSIRLLSITRTVQCPYLHLLFNFFTLFKSKWQEQTDRRRMSHRWCLWRGADACPQHSTARNARHPRRLEIRIPRELVLKGYPACEQSWREFTNVSIPAGNQTRPRFRREMQTMRGLLTQTLQRPLHGLRADHTMWPKT